MMRLYNKRIVITGAGRGLGAFLAGYFFGEGASVLLCARDKTAVRQVANFLSANCEKKRVLWASADVSDSNDVASVFEMVETKWGGLDVLVNNAAVHGPLCKFHESDWNLWAQAIKVNLLGSALMCKYALPLLLRGGEGRIIQLSGGGATCHRANFSAYAASKAGVVRLVETLAEEYRDNNIFVNAIAPGPLNTRLLDEVLEAGPERVGRKFHEKALLQKKQGGVPMERAAELAVFLASDASWGITGRLISAIWDPWERLQEYREELAKSDIYTLRRIVPEDRGMDWGRV